MKQFENNDKAKMFSPVVLESSQLFQGKREVVILHNQDRYRLLITKANKLILNK